MEDLKDHIKSIIDIGEGITVGRLDETKSRTIALTDLGNIKRSIVGGNQYAGFKEKRVSILLHWSQSAIEAEIKADQIYHKLHESKYFKVGNLVVNFIICDTPTFLGYRNEICEYAIDLKVNYKEE